MRKSKNMVTVSKRMEEVISLVSRGKRVADVGTDHGYVSIALVERGIAPSVIAMDIRKGPLSRAKENIEKYGLAKEIDTRLSDGLEQVKTGEIDTFLIAGMGGDLIANILQNGIHIVESVNEFIVQPQSEIYKVRKKIHQLGFQIQMEKMLVEDEKYYTIIKAVRGQEVYENEWDYLYGKALLQEKHPILYEWLQREHQLREQLYKRLESIVSENTELRKKELMEDMKLLKGALSYYETERTDRTT